MKYHMEKPPYTTNHYGELYFCDHPLYDACTLFKIGSKGIAVIQQKHDGHNKTTYWGALEEWIPDTLYLNEGFKDFFDEYAAPPRQGLYPTIPVRKLMWHLKMKPLPKPYWETVFDRKMDIL